MKPRVAGMDALVASKVMGWPTIDDCEPYRFHRDKGGVVVNGHAQKFRGIGVIPDEWRPQHMEADAMDVVRHLLAHRCRVNIHIHPDEGATVQVIPLDPLVRCPPPGKAERLPVAICAAALAWSEARGAQ